MKGETLAAVATTNISNNLVSAATTDYVFTGLCLNKVP